MVKPCLIYLRVSSEDQNPENQLNDCMDYAMGFLGYSRDDIEVITEYISAYKNPDRDVLKAFLSRKDVVSWRFDRIQRNRKKFIEVMRSSSQLGTRIHSVKEVWLRDLHKVPAPWNEMIYDFMLQIIGWFAEDESRKISERTKAGLARKKAQNKLPVRGTKKYDFDRIWQEYKNQGSINRVGKVLPYGYATVHFIISNDIHDQESYDRARREETERKKNGQVIENGGV